MRKIALLALLLIFCVSGAAFAQEATPEAMPVFCGKLSDADCAILTQSQTAMKSLDSASYDVTFNLAVSDVPGMSAPLTIDVTGNGAYSGLSAIASAVTDNMSDPGKMLSGLLSQLKFDGTIVVNFSPDVAQMAGIPASITVQERLVDGVGYLNLDTLSALMGRSRLRGWYGLDLAGFLEAAMAEMPDMFNGSMSGMGNMDAMQGYEQAFMNPDFYNRLLSIERTDDGSGETANFAIKVNLASLMTIPEFKTMMTDQLKMQGTTMSDAEMGQTMAMLSQMFKGMSVTINEEIGLSDSFLHRVSGSIAFDTTGMMKAMTPQTSTSPASTAPAPTINIDFSYAYSDFNDAPAITAPAGATIIPYQSLLQRPVSA